MQKGKFYRPWSAPEARIERSCQSYSSSHIEWRAERSFLRPTFIRPGLEVQDVRQTSTESRLVDIYTFTFIKYTFIPGNYDENVGNGSVKIIEQTLNLVPYPVSIRVVLFGG